MSTKRERILDWMRNGSPDDIPVMVGPGFGVAASFLGKDQREITWRDAVDAAERTGTHNIACVCSPLPFHAIPFIEDIDLIETWENLPDGTPRLTRVIKTPEGDLREVQEFPKDKGGYHREFFVKGESDLPALACFIRKTTAEVVRNPAVCESLKPEIEQITAEVGGAFPLNLWVFPAAVELTSSYYMDQQTAVYVLYDCQELFEELFERHWQMTQVWLDLGEKHSIDIYGYAINGLEWLSPDLYERYMIPQARRINDFVRAHGKLSWVHTCGKLAKLAAGGVYDEMAVDLVESLSSPPTGDILDLARTRADIGDRVTRGGINVELFYGTDLKALEEQANYVLDATKGFKHMLGDTNDSYPAYPWENIRTVIDIVRSRGRLYE